LHFLHSSERVQLQAAIYGMPICTITMHERSFPSNLPHYVGLALSQEQYPTMEDY
jgi:hypothetical protein